MRRNVPQRRNNTRSNYSYNNFSNNNNNRFQRRYNYPTNLRYNPNTRFRRADKGYFIQPRRFYRRTLNQKISTLNQKVNRLINKKENKATNTNRPSKLPKYNKLVSPMDMALCNRYISIYPSSSRVIRTSTYSRFTLNFNVAHTLIWFPYAVNFNFGPEEFEVDVLHDKIANELSSFIAHADGIQGHFRLTNLTKCGVFGSYRLIGATIKIKNTTPEINKGGEYTVYKAVVS